MPISRGQMPRQMYGLGSLVKSIGKTVKKIVKSPIGKAAILGFGANALMPGGLSSLFSGGGGLTGILSKGKDFIGGLSTAKKITGALALGGAFAGMEDQQVEELKRNPEALRSYLAQYYRNLNKGASDQEVNRFVEANMTEYKADGGRIGYNEGTGDPTYTGNNMEDLPRGLQIDTTTSNPIPEDAPQQEISEVAKIMLGPGRSGIGEPEDGTMKGYQFFRKKYLPKKVTEIAENYGIEENEVLRMIRDEMMQYIDAPKSLKKPEMANGGRMRYNEGTPEMGMIDPDKEKQAKQMIGMGADQDLISTITGLTKEQIEFLMRENKAYGGRMGFAMGNPEENAIQASGIMDLPLNQNPAGITELDLRETGGFIPPVGVKEKADDIPAMLSNNEFVFTADAVRGMGNGNVNKGAQRMYDMMKKLEKGGRV